MEEVDDLLIAWDLTDLIPTFRKNAINIQALASLKPEEIKELIPQIGPRALFNRCWKTWMLDFTGANEFNILDTTNISLSNIEIEKELETQTVGQETQTVGRILIKLLNESLEASSLLVGVGNCLPGDTARNLLSSIIAKEILKTYTDLPITNAVYNKWCTEIKKIYPKERITTYYIPPCITAKGVTHQARGKLISQVLNTRRKYQKLGVLSVKTKRSREDSPTSSTTSTTSRLNIIDKNELDEEIDVEEQLQWLENSSDPWNIVEGKWKVTIKQRMQLLKNKSVEEYLTEFPALKKPHGFRLLHIDFDAVYPQHAENLQLNFPVTKPKLLQMLKNKNTKDPFYQELITLADCPNEEVTNIAAFLTLPHLISTNVISAPTSSKNKKTGKEKKWKPTKIETRESFIAHIRDDSHLRLTIDKRHSTYLEKGFTVQPYIIIVGPTLSDIKSYFVVINSVVFYSRNNILSAVDSCFKGIWVLNLEYSADCYGVWYFIQKGFYKITSSHDKGSTSAESLLTDCILFFFIMVVCFLCNVVLTNFAAFKGHLSIFHKKVDYKTLICAEENCGRKFNLFNSFKRHILTQHHFEGPINDSEQIEQPAYSNANERVPLDNCDIEDAHVEVLPLAVFPDDSSNERATSEDIFDKVISLFIAGLYANDFLPRNVVQTIVDGFRTCVSSALLPAIKKNLEDLSQNGSIPHSLIQTVINSITPLLTDTWNKFSTEHKRLQHFEAQNFFIKPRSIVIGQRLETVIEKGVRRLKPVTCEQAVISLRLVLTQFFSLKDVLLDTLKYMESLNNNMILPNFAIENFIQGSYWKTVQERYGDKVVMPLFMFFDDYEPGNVLGSRAGQHKLGAVYVSIPCLPPCRSSVLTNIFLVLLFHSSDRSFFGNNVIFQCVIDEFNYLSENGVDIDIPGFKGTIYFELGLLLGDNLGIHSITGFLESFSANYSCLVCRVRKDIMKYQVEEDISLLRNRENYESDLLRNQPSETGIKEKCVWHGVKNFNLFDQVGVDSMHDVLEGVAKYIMSFLICYFIRNANFFSLEQLNYKLQGFSYGPDERNRPCSLSLDHLTQGNVRLSASEMLVLIRYFGLLTGEYIPTDNEHWSLYLKLRTVVELLSATAFGKGTEELLQTNISELNSMYVSLSKDTLKPKFHNLLHYHTALLKFGPIISLWSMRFEAKHRISKIVARTSCNKKNLTLTLATKHQLKLNEMFLRGELDSVIKTGPELSISSLETKYIIDNLPISQTNKLVKVSWIKVSSTHYAKNTVLVYSLDLDNGLLEFFRLNEVYLYECDVILKGVLLKTINFNEHFFAYEVKEPQVLKTVIKLHNDLVSPIPCTLNIVSDKVFVTLRSPI